MLTRCTVTATTGLWCVAQFISINKLSTQTQDTSMTNNNTQIDVCMRQKHNVAEISISINDSLLCSVPLPSAQQQLHGVDWSTWGGRTLKKDFSASSDTQPESDPSALHPVTRNTAEEWIAVDVPIWISKCVSVSAVSLSYYRKLLCSWIPPVGSECGPGAGKPPLFELLSPNLKTPPR